jgi:hypothetical protein
VLCFYEAKGDVNKEVITTASSTSVGLNLSRNLSLLLGPGLRQVKTLLKIQPKLGTCSEIPRQTEGSLGSDGAAPMHDLPNARCRDMDVHSELMLANLKRLQELLQQYFPGMSRNTLKHPACSGFLDSMHVFFP